MAESSVTPANLETAFNEKKITPNIIKVAPTKLFSISYPNGDSVQLGNELKPSRVIETPSVKWHAEKGAYYTLIMFDPDSPAEYSEVRHWLVMNIPESAVENGDEVTAYLGSGTRSGTHRYIFLVYKQPNGKIEHNEPRSAKWSISNRLKTSIADLVEKYNLGNPEFGNFYLAQYEPYVDTFYQQLKK